MNKAKHAYLIIAHHEFGILQKLIDAIDDHRNDIFIHFDKKVLILPELTSQFSRLVILDDRIDTRWGHISQIETEYLLLESAYKFDETYCYFHMISGVHLPLYNQDIIHQYFEKKKERQLFSPMTINNHQIDLKIRKYNFFMRTFSSKNRLLGRYSQIAWRIAHVIQDKFGIRKTKSWDFKNASNWVSITKEAVSFLMKNKKQIVKKYRYSFCGDEFFIPTELHQSSLNETIYYDKRLLKHQIESSNAMVYSQNDLTELLESKCLFARKFSEKDPIIVEEIMNRIKTRIDN